MDNDKTLFWVVGIILLIIILSKLPFAPAGFAIVTTQVCVDGVTNYYSLDGNLLDLSGNLDATNYGATFISGKINQGILFNTTNYISFPDIDSNLSVGMWINNYSNDDGWNYIIYEDTSILSDTFMLGFNGSIDEIVVGTNISGLSNIQPCYQTISYENLTCKNYATEMVAGQTGGCLNYSKGFFPECEYSWLSTSGYSISGGECLKRLYCEDILSSDYSTFTVCQDKLNETVTTPPTTTPPPTPPPEETIRDKLNKEVFEIGGVSITLLHLLIALAGIIIIIYYFQKK